MIKRVERVISRFQEKHYAFKVLLEYSNPRGNSDLHSLNQIVILEGCENPSEIELKLIKERTPLYDFKREWIKGIERDNYIDLCNFQLLNSIRKYPGSYLVSELKLHYDLRFIPAY